MNASLILYPVIALVALTMVIWFLMYKRRVREIISKRISLLDIGTRSGSSRLLKDVTAAENFSNLLEAPVLFYLICLCLYVTNLVSYTHIVIAWGYVILRVVHSTIHVTSNRVKYRFYVYATSTISLFVMWVIFAVQLITLKL